MRYGSTNCGLRQFESSILKECRNQVGVRTTFRDIVLTELLLSGSTIQKKQMLVTGKVARTLVSWMRAVKGSLKVINYLTPLRMLLALVSAWVR
ncbi:chlorophyll b reductase [Artemisia annua]|uniref:Chlorophyll b reductase n=1 Tax=Artemisia annua TaxID=35608 RepID=A0A2U1LHU8_ARTAN|nr:chlorophyll b reductase [Artemisia annua]